MRPQWTWWRTAGASGVLVLAAVATPLIDAQPVVAKGTTQALRRHGCGRRADTDRGQLQGERSARMVTCSRET